ncbi:MAG: hypothetical protein KF800_00590 [Lysobacter sp.]|jgi:hypothetical protein|nr:hypothetical protein [Lysobacter sp.]
MTKSFLYGTCIALFAFATTLSGNAAANTWPSCTEANDGQIMVSSSAIWECIAGFGWLRIAICNSNGCVYV